MVLNGINYTEKHLTDEEMAVIEAMRMGAKVEANFFQSDYNAMMEHFDSLDKDDLFTWRASRNLSASSYFEARSEHVKIGHFIDK